MRRFLGVFVIVLGGAVAAQQSTFRSGVSLVTVEVTVLDKDGNPVPGLTPADFEIKLNGKAQPVKALAFVQASTGSAAAPKPDATAQPSRVALKPAATLVAKEVEVRRTVSNQDDAAPAAPIAPAQTVPVAPSAPATPAHQNEPRTFVLLMDDLSFPAVRGKKMFAAAQKFVTSVPASDAVGFTTTSGSLTVNPTLDRAAVFAGLAKVVGQYVDPRLIDPSGRSFSVKETREQPLGIDQAMEIDRGNDSELRTAIVRECLGGSPSSIAGKATSEVIQNSDCAAGIASEARRTAQLTKQVRARQLDAIKAVVNAMRSASGIRHLVVLTDGIAIQRDVDEVQPVTVAAAKAGVQLSMLMEDPDAVTMENPISADDGNRRPRADGGFSGRVREDNKLVLNGAQTVTDMLGGSFYRVVGDPSPLFERILAASSAVYRLGVELPAGAQPGKELSLGVSLKRTGLTVHASKMAVNVPDASASADAPGGKPGAPAATDAPKMITEPQPVSIDDVLKAALNQNQDLRGVPIRLGAMIRRSTNAEGQIDLSVNVTFPASVKTPITALVGIVDETNALKISRRVIDSTAGPAQFLFPLPAGSYAIRFGAAAADGALGTVELPVAVKLRTLGAFTASDVLMFSVGDTSQKASLFSLDDVPAALEPSKYFASLELYPAGPMPDEPPVVNWTIVREGNAKPIVDEDTEGRVGTKLFRADFEVPYASLAPGTYVVRATLMAGDKPAGTVAATLRKR